MGRTSNNQNLLRSMVQIYFEEKSDHLLFQSYTTKGSNSEVQS